MTAAGENILAWLDAAISLREEKARRLGGKPFEVKTYQWGATYLEGAEMHEDEIAHIALHDPESVLRRCAADRKLLELHRPAILRGGGGAKYFETTRVCRSCEPPRQFPENAWPCPTLLALGEGYGWKAPTETSPAETGAGQTPPTDGDPLT